MKRLANRKLFQMAQFNRCEPKRHDALNELISRFAEQGKSEDIKCPHKKPIEISDFITICRNTKSESTAMLFLESLHKESLINPEGCEYVIIYGCTEKVSLRAFEILITISDPSTKSVRRVIKSVPVERGELRSIIQEYIIAHVEADEDDYRFLAERGETEILAARSLKLLLEHPELSRSSLGRIYRKGFHPTVREFAGQYLYCLTQQA